MAQIKAEQAFRGLPSPSTLQQETGRSEIFADLKDWVRGLLKQGELQQVACSLDVEHRRAIQDFLEQESKAGVRSNRAKELLATLADLPAFAYIAANVVDSETETRLDSESACDSTGGSSNALDIDAEPPVDSDLPTAADFDNPRKDRREIFQKLRTWIKNERQQGRLAEAGAALGATYRRSVFQFLSSFVDQKTIFREQAREMLARLAALDTWCEGNAAEGEAVARALADAQSTGSFAPPPKNHDPEDLAAMILLPSQARLEDPTTDCHENLQRLYRWVEAGRRSGRLELRAQALQPSHRQAIMAFLGADDGKVFPTAPSTPAPPPRRGNWAMKYASPKKSQGGITPSCKASGVAPESVYVLLSLAELGDLFPVGEGGDQNVVSRVLAVTKPAIAG